MLSFGTNQARQNCDVERFGEMPHSLSTNLHSHSDTQLRKFSCKGKKTDWTDPFHVHILGTFSGDIAVPTRDYEMERNTTQAEVAVIGRRRRNRYEN